MVFGDSARSGGGGGGGGDLPLASIGFAGVGVGVGAEAGGSGYKEGLLVMALPKEDDLDVAKAVEGVGVRMPDVSTAVRVKTLKVTA